MKYVHLGCEIELCNGIYRERLLRCWKRSGKSLQWRYRPRCFHRITILYETSTHHAEANKLRRMTTLSAASVRILPSFIASMKILFNYCEEFALWSGNNLIAARFTDTSRTKFQRGAYLSAFILPPYAIYTAWSHYWQKWTCSFCLRGWARNVQRAENISSKLSCALCPKMVRELC